MERCSAFALRASVRWRTLGRLLSGSAQSIRAQRGTLGLLTAKEITMNFRSQASPFLWGAASGAIALAIVGFNWGGWVTGGTAEKLAGARAESATLASLVPI